MKVRLNWLVGRSFCSAHPTKSRYKDDLQMGFALIDIVYLARASWRSDSKMGFVGVRVGHLTAIRRSRINLDSVPSKRRYCLVSFRSIVSTNSLSATSPTQLAKEDPASIRSWPQPLPDAFSLRLALFRVQQRLHHRLFRSSQSPTC